MCSPYNSFVLINASSVLAYSPNSGWTHQESCVIINGKFAAIGRTHELLQRFPDAKQLDVGGLCICPGFIDSHAHMLELGLALKHRVVLSGCKSVTEAVQRVAKHVNEHSGVFSENIWVVGCGWDQNQWEEPALPKTTDLDMEPSLQHLPVVLYRVDFHALWCSSTVIRNLEAKGLLPPKDTHIPGGHIMRDGDGSPTGIFVDNAMDIVTKQMPQLSVEQRVPLLQTAIAECNKYGLVGVHDANVDPETLQALDIVLHSGPARMRVYAMLSASSYPEPPSMKPKSPVLVVKACKMFMDGALGSRGAALLSDYADEPGNKGILILDNHSVLSALINKWVDAGYQVCTHAIGDAANRALLNAYESVPEQKRKKLKLRVEHAQIVTDEDVPRFSKLGVIASMQPGHCTSDMDWAGLRLGPEREKEAYRWADFLKAGTSLCFGSDFPVETPNPLEGFWAAIKRSNSEGKSWHSSQCVPRETALTAYTYGAAAAANMETEIGSISEGLPADFVVLSGDPLSTTVSRESLHVVATYLDGICVYGTPLLSK